MARNREMVLGWNSQRWKPPMEPRPSLASPRSSRCDDDRELLRSLAGSHRSALSRLRFHPGAYMAPLGPAPDRKWQLGYRHSARKGSVGLRACTGGRPGRAGHRLPGLPPRRGHGDRAREPVPLRGLRLRCGACVHRPMNDADIRAELATLAERELLAVIGELRAPDGWRMHERVAQRLETVLKRVRRIGGLND